MSKRKGRQLIIASWCKRPVFTNVIRTVDDDVALKLFNCTVIKKMTTFVVPTNDVFRFSEQTIPVDAAEVIDTFALSGQHKLNYQII